ncbi:MAG: tetratricopeptide repeat protein [Bdellovibrionota bacterium]
MRIKSVLLTTLILSTSAIAAPGEGKAYLERGVQSFEAGQNKEAQSFFQEAIKQNANDDTAYMWLGKTYEEDKYYDKALKEYQRALVLNPKNAETSFLMGRIYFNKKDFGNAKGYLEKAPSDNASAHAMLGEIHLAEKNDSKARSEFKKAIKINSSLENARIGLMEIDLKEKKPNEMVKELEAMKLDFPNNIRAKNLLAKAYYSNADYDSALREYSDVLRRSSDNKEAWYGIGQTMEKTGKYSQSQTAYEKAASYGYPAAQVNLGLGRVAAAQKKYAEANALLERSYQANQKNNAPLIEQANIAILQSKWDDAQVLLQKAAVVGSGGEKREARISYLSGLAYARQKKYPQAEKMLQTAVKQDRANRQAQYELAQVYQAQNKNDAAYSEFNKLSNGNDAIAANSLQQMGEIQLSQKKFKAAYETLNKASRLKPDEPTIWNGIGEAAMEMGNTQEALENFNRSIAFNTNDARAYSNKAKAHSMRKEWQASKKAYEKVLQIKTDSVSDWEGLAYVSEQANEYQSQVQALERLEHLQPQNIKYSLKLADTYRSKDNFPLAKKAYLRVIAVDERNVHSLRSIAQMAEANRQFSEAQTYYKKVLEIEPNDETSLRSMGRISFDEGQYSKAEFYYGSLLKVQRRDADAANKLAIAKEKNKGSTQDVIAAYENAYSIDPKANLQAGLRAASLRKQSGDQKGAIGKYERVLNQNPENIEAMTEKADLQAATKDWTAAVASYEALHAKKAPTQKAL